VSKWIFLLHFLNHLSINLFFQVFPKGSPLAADFSQIILKLSEDGTLKQLEDKWFALSLTSCPMTPNGENTDNLTLDSFWALFTFTGATTTIIFLLFKARLLPDYSHRTCQKLGVPLREKCVKVWNSKLRSRKERQLSRRRSFPSPQVAPEPCDDTSIVEEQNHTNSEIEVGSLPQNNI